MIITVTEKEIKVAVIEYLEKRGMTIVDPKDKHKIYFSYRKDDNTVTSADLEVKFEDKE